MATMVELILNIYLEVLTKPWMKEKISPLPLWCFALILARTSSGNESLEASVPFSPK
jgi:hypothetical protein